MSDDEALKIVIHWAKIGLAKTAKTIEAEAIANEAIRIMEDIKLEK